MGMGNFMSPGPYMQDPLMMISGMGPMAYQYQTMNVMMMVMVVMGVLLMCCCCGFAGCWFCYNKHEEDKRSHDEEMMQIRRDESNLQTIQVMAVSKQKPERRRRDSW